MKISDIVIEKIWVDPNLKPSKRFWDGDVAVLKDKTLEERLDKLMSKSRFNLDVYFLDKELNWSDEKNKESDGYEGFFMSRKMAAKLNIPLDTKFRFFSKRPDANNLIVVMTNTEADNALKLSPWLIVHRCVHAFFDSAEIYKTIAPFEFWLENALSEIYNVDSQDSRYMVQMLNTLLTMGSARKKKIRYYFDDKNYEWSKNIGWTDVTSSGDWITEMITQSIVSGLKLNQFPNKIIPVEKNKKSITNTKIEKVPGLFWGTRDKTVTSTQTIEEPLQPGIANPEKLKQFNNSLRSVEKEFNDAVTIALNKCRGKIAVL
jgi:hypothetical protein